MTMQDAYGREQLTATATFVAGCHVIFSLIFCLIAGLPPRIGEVVRA